MQPPSIMHSLRVYFFTIFKKHHSTKLVCHQKFSFRIFLYKCTQFKPKLSHPVLCIHCGFTSTILLKTSLSKISLPSKNFSFRIILYILSRSKTPQEPFPMKSAPFVYITHAPSARKLPKLSYLLHQNIKFRSDQVYRF